MLFFIPNWPISADSSILCWTKQCCITWCQKDRHRCCVAVLELNIEEERKKARLAQTPLPQVYSILKPQTKNFEELVDIDLPCAQSWVSLLRYWHDDTSYYSWVWRRRQRRRSRGGVITFLHNILHKSKKFFDKSMTCFIHAKMNSGRFTYIFSFLYLHAVCKLVLLPWLCNLFGLTLTG